MSGQDRLKLDRIDTDLVLSPEANRYLLLVLNTGRSALTLTGVNAINAPAQPESEHISPAGEGSGYPKVKPCGAGNIRSL